MKTRAATLFAVLALLGAAVDWVSKEIAFGYLNRSPGTACVPVNQDEKNPADPQGRSVLRRRGDCQCSPPGAYTNEVEIVRGFYWVGHTWNHGIVFGMGQGLGPIFLVVSVLAVPIIIAIFWSMRNPGWTMTASLGLILGGTIGNMYDRVRWGAVRDFIKFKLPVYGEWPVFNIADSCICVGVFLLTVEMMLFDEKKKKEEPAPAPAAAVAEAPNPAPAPAATPSEPHGPNG